MAFQQLFGAPHIVELYGLDFLRYDIDIEYRFTPKRLREYAVQRLEILLRGIATRYARYENVSILTYVRPTDKLQIYALKKFGFRKIASYKVVNTEIQLFFRKGEYDGR
jgi:hypothetical protein